MATVTTRSDSDYSPTWKWEPGEALEGTHVEFRTATVDGRDVVVWDIDGHGLGPVSVWLDPAVLKQKVRAELERRRAAGREARLEPGERVRIDPGTKRPSQRSPGQSFWPFPVVEFELAAPERSAEEFLLADGDMSEEPVAAVRQETAATVDDDDIPF